MASARSTVSIARTTPAQKPRGEHNITFRCGFSEDWEDVMSVLFQGSQTKCARKPQAQDWFFCSRPCQACGRPKGKSFIAGDEWDAEIAEIAAAKARRRHS